MVILMSKIQKNFFLFTKIPIKKIRTVIFRNPSVNTGKMTSRNYNKNKKYNTISVTQVLPFGANTKNGHFWAAILDFWRSFWKNLDFLIFFKFTIMGSFIMPKFKVLHQKLKKKSSNCHVSP